MFHLSTTGTALHGDEGTCIPDYCGTSGFDRVLARIRALEDGDRERQAHFIRVSLASHESRRERRMTVLECEPGSPAAARAVDEAVAIGEALRRVAIPSGDGGVTWIALSDAPPKPSLREIDLGLCHGRSGIALFLAALARVTGREGDRDLAFDALGPLLGPLDDGRGGRDVVRQAGLGGASGVGGLLYALTRAGELLEAPLLTCAAARVASFVTPQDIASDDKLDVFAGSAGLLLGVLALHEATGDAMLLELAAACADRLLSARVTDAVSGHQAWATQAGELGTGFGHGAAGIAYALLCLHRRTAAPELREAAAEAYEFEADLFRPELHNWLDRASLRNAPPETLRLMCGWCHGAAGIGLARVSALDVLDSERARRDIEAALAAVDESGLARPDRLCCGNLGRAELLLCAGRRLDRPDLVERAAAMARTVTARARRRGTYGGGTLDHCFTPTLFYGIAGIGYELLRLSEAARLPSVLLLE
jgi:type 2 lantibiotic biosynthesis protein LanM